jgi:uncharacterized membrane protein
MTGLRVLRGALVAAGALVLAVPAVAVADSGAGGVAAACAWRLDSRLPVPVGFTGGQVTATDGVAAFAGIVQNGTAGRTQAVVWQGGVASLLPTPAGSISAAYGLNRGGDVVGSTTSILGPAGRVRPALWRRGQLIQLGTASAGTAATARDINDAGLIVGEATEPGAGASQAVAWSADAPDRFQVVRAPGKPSALVAVTEAGILAGSSGDPTGASSRTVAVTGTVAAGLHVLADPPAPATSSLTAAAGAYLAGSVTAPGDTAHATVWRSETATVLSKRDSVAAGVNSAGDAAGYDQAAHTALVWIGGVEQELPVIIIGPAAVGAAAQVVTEDSATVGGTITESGGPRPVLWHCG